MPGASGSARDRIVVMAVLPNKLSELVAFCQARVTLWTAPANIGLTPAQIASLSAAVNNATDKMALRTSAESAALAATAAQRTAGTDLRQIAAECVRSIKTFAEAQAKPELVYEEAQIPAPQPPSPAPAPAQPTNLTVAINPASGALVLRWKCANPRISGVSYIVRRRAAGETGWTFVGVTGTKTFTDSSFLAGPDSVQYTVQGARSGVEGTISPIYTVNFGKDPGGGLTATVTEQQPKLAA